MSDSESGGSGASSSPEPELTKAVLKGKKSSVKRSKDKNGTSSKNESLPADWAFEPPREAVLVDHDIDAGDFDWDSVKNAADDELEVWLIRIPQGFKPKNFTNVKLNELPVSEETAQVGTVQRKTMSYDIWSVGTDDHPALCGEELKNLTCMLPRKSKKGKLFQAPKAISRRLIIAAQPVAPTQPEPSSSQQIQTYQNPPRPSHAKALLTHRFEPYGYNTPVGGDNDVDIHDEEMETEELMVEKEKEEQETSKEPEKSKKSKKVAKKKAAADAVAIEVDAETPDIPQASSPPVEKRKGKKRKEPEGEDGSSKKSNKKAKVVS